ncbi:MAG: polynucleotide adenylyltransferase [Puniceicoccales bacterium]|jgi:tRNA nucleotidyltransferase (CCA-adding enzyme)|nr:polynucleotide adenylyltransferase [Puniceicoccales bacterium]
MEIIAEKSIDGNGINPRLIEICSQIRNAGGRAYLVGGCVRDLLLQISPKDWDVEVFSMDPPALESLFAGCIEPVGKSFGIHRFRHFPIDIGFPRKESAIGSGHRDFSVSIDPYLPVKSAAARRDFTINAIYYDPLEQSIEDPFGGVEDLQGKYLRHVSSQFSEDPLRVLRGMQFVSRFALTATAETISLCKQLTPKHLSNERIYCEFCKLILLGEKIGDGLEFLRHANWLPFFPELEAMESCQQDSAYHPEGSVWNHVKFATDAFSRFRPHGEWDALVTGFAVLCHDLGKPLCTRWNAAGRICARGHDRAGILPTQQFLSRVNAPQALVEEVLPLVEFHMVPRTFADGKNATAASLNHLANSVKRIDRLLVVARCDRSGRSDHVPSLVGEDRLEAMAKEANLWTSSPVPLIHGRDLLEHFRLTPSPKIGILVKQIYEAQLDAKFSCYEDALAYARSLI